MQINELFRDIIIMIARNSEPIYSALASTCKGFHYLIELKKDFKLYFGHRLSIYENELMYTRHRMIHRLDGPAYEVFEASRDVQLRDLSTNNIVKIHDGKCGLSAEYQAIKIWFRNGKIHRDSDEPALYKIDGGLVWYKLYKIHRDVGPAIIRGDGGLEWIRHGLRHRNGGPAVEHGDVREWWVDGYPA